MAAYRGMLDGFEKFVAGDIKRLRRMARSLERWGTVGGSLPPLAARYSFAMQAVDHPCTCDRKDVCETCRAANELRDFWAPFDLDAPLLTALDLMSGRRGEARLWAALNSIEDAIATGTNNFHITRAMMDAGLAAAGLDAGVLDGDAEMDECEIEPAAKDEECAVAVHGCRPQLRLLRGELSDESQQETPVLRKPTRRASQVRVGRRGVKRGRPALSRRSAIRARSVHCACREFPTSRREKYG